MKTVNRKDKVCLQETSSVKVPSSDLNIMVFKMRFVNKTRLSLERQNLIFNLDQYVGGHRDIDLCCVTNRKC